MDRHKYMYTCRCKHCEHGIVLDHFLTHRSRLRKWVSSATWMRFYTFLRLGNLHKRYEIALGNPPKLVEIPIPKTNMASWKLTIFSWKYIFIHGWLSSQSCWFFGGVIWCMDFLYISQICFSHSYPLPIQPFKLKKFNR